MSKMKRVGITQDIAKPVADSVLAQSIVDISKAMAKLATSGLNRKAIVLLVAHSSLCSQREVKAVLDSLESLQRDYTTL